MVLLIMTDVSRPLAAPAPFSIKELQGTVQRREKPIRVNEASNNTVSCQEAPCILTCLHPTSSSMTHSSQQRGYTYIYISLAPIGMLQFLVNVSPILNTHVTIS